PTDGRRHERFADYPERIARVNQQLKALAQAFPHAHYLDNSLPLDSNGDGHLDIEYHVGDGVHLSERGYAQWIGSLRSGLAGLSSGNQ
ncbi:MAG: hypothetical protein AAGJ10_20595, partial [Bacteroidota bacterium]